LRDPVAELTTVADDHAVVFRGPEVRVHDGLAPDTDYDIDGFSFRTLPRPGAQLAVVATVNDVHFGELECGVLAELHATPLRAPEGAEPYPVTMNRAAIREIAAIAPDAVVAKGDLTSDGTVEQYEQFRSWYGGAFGDRLHHVRGNHDAYGGASFAAEAPIEVELPGVRLAVVDTTDPGRPSGAIALEQLEWLDELAARSDRPVLVFGHHHIWRRGHDLDGELFFGIRPEDSDRLAQLVARRPAVVGYFAGHTHRNRVVHRDDTGTFPWVEVACVKDFPGTWAEYRVFEGGITQIHHRIAAPDALAWSERTRELYQPFDYVEYALGALADRCFLIPPR
jgi:Icc protein